MKNKFSLLVLGLVLTGTSYSQGNNGNTPADTNAQSNTRWKLDGNTLSTDKFIGTLNQKDLIFKSNNVEGLRILPNKDFKIPGQIYIDLHRPLDPGKDRLLTVDVDGKVKSMEKSGLLGALYSSPCLDAGLNIHFPVWAKIDGTVSPLTHGVLYTGTTCPAWVGIGTDNPLAQLHVTTTGYFGNSINIGVNPSTLVARLNIEQPAPQRSGIVVNMTNSTSSNFTGVGIKTIVKNPLRKAFTVVDGTTNQGVFVVKGNGSVGIGNNTPQTELDVTGSGLFTGTLSIGAFPSSTINTKLHVYSPASSQTIALHIDAPNAADWSYVQKITLPNGYAKAIAVVDKDTQEDSFDVLANGTVQIRNQTAGLSSFSVTNEANENVFKVKGNGSVTIANQTAGLKSIRVTDDSNQGVFVVKGNGSVGIGNNTPQTELDVTGSGLFTGTLSIGALPSAANTKLHIYSPASSQSTALHIDAPNAPDWSFVQKITIPDGKAKAIAVVNDTYGTALNILGTGEIMSYISDPYNAFVMYNRLDNDKKIFQVLANGSVNIANQTAGLKSISVSDDANEDLFRVMGDGTVSIRNQQGSTKAFFITNNNSLNEDVFRVYGNGVVYATTIMVRTKDNFPDYVFKKDYELLSLSELERYIIENKHLPNVPTEAEVKENGIDVSELLIIQMKKIEELTLYILQQQKEIEVLKTEVNNLK